MWIFFQICLFLFLLSAAMVLPKKVYSVLIGATMIFTVIEIFVPWLFIVQMIVITVASSWGHELIDIRNDIFKDMAKIRGIKQIVAIFNIIGYLIKNVFIKIKNSIITRGRKIDKWFLKLSGGTQEVIETIFGLTVATLILLGFNWIMNYIFA